MTAPLRSDGMHVAHTATGWVVFDNSLSHPSRLSGAYPSRAAATARKRALARALRHQRSDDVPGI